MVIIIISIYNLRLSSLCLALYKGEMSTATALHLIRKETWTNRRRIQMHCDISGRGRVQRRRRRVSPIDRSSNVTLLQRWSVPGHDARGAQDADSHFESDTQSLPSIRSISFTFIRIASLRVSTQHVLYFLSVMIQTIPSYKHIRFTCYYRYYHTVLNIQFFFT